MSKKPKNLYDLQKFIDKESRCRKIDTALLFFSSSLSIGFTFVYAFFGKSILISFLPALILGWFMPVYIGYVRGSLTIDRAEERARGWIYLIVGAGLYCAIVIIDFVFHDITGTLVEAVKLILVATISFTFGCFGASIGPWIQKICGQRVTAKAKKAFYLTFLSSLSMVFLFYLLHAMSQPGKIEELGISDVIIYVIMICMLGLFFILLERKARKFVYTH